MAKHYTSTSKTVSVTDYAYGGGSWATISLAVTISAAGAVSYTISCNHSSEGQWQYKGLIATLNGYTIANNSYYSSAKECEADFGKGSRFPINDNSSYSGTAGTVTGGSVSYELKLNCQSDGDVHGWSGSTTTNYKGTTESGTISRNYWTDIGTGTVSITDNGNNSYTVSGGMGSAGTNNAINGATLYWASGKDSTGNWDYSTQSFSTGSSKTVSFTPTSAATRTVAGAVVTDGVHNDTDTGWITKSIKQYKDPGAPGKPVLDASSYRNGRLTIKQNWKYTWTAGTDGTGSCPVLGYRIRIYKNGSLLTGFSASSNSVLIKNSGTNEYVDRAGKTDCTIIIDPVSFGFVPGDTIQIGIYAYAQNGAGWWLYNGGGLGTAQVCSDTSTVQNSGIMRVKPAGSWKEGVVWVKVNNTWVEAEVVYTKVSNVWKEST